MTRLERGRRAHFYKRVRERIGPDVDAKMLWAALVFLVAQPNPDHIRFVCRLSRTGRRLWKFSMGGKWHLVIFDHKDGHPVTILSPDRRIYPQEHISIDLRTLV